VEYVVVSEELSDDEEICTGDDGAYTGDLFEQYTFAS
jgi:hypothetical protein